METLDGAEGMQMIDVAEVLLIFYLSKTEFSEIEYGLIGHSSYCGIFYSKVRLRKTISIICGG